jgi:DNA topoisomerase-1
VLQEELNALVKDKLNKEKNAKKIASLTERLEKAKLNMNMKEELKTVSLGTSKINYLDPRITIAWCKKWEMPINLVYTKALMEKFNWAMVRPFALSSRASAQPLSIGEMHRR